MENHLLQIEQQITDLEYLNQEEANKACYQAILQHPSCTHISELDVVIKHPSKKVLRADNRLQIDNPHFEIVLVDSSEGKIINYTCCVINDAIHINGRPTLHTSVWRPFFNINEEIIQQLSQTTFSNYLLGKYNIMATLANMQTHGFTFWLSRICTSRNEHCSAYGYRIGSGEIRPITTVDQRGKEKVWLWNVGNTQYRLLLTPQAA